MPLAIVLLGGMVAHPFLFVLVPLLMLGVVALGVTDFGEKSVMDFYRGQKRVVGQQAQVAAGPQRRNRQSRADGAMAQPERMLSQRELEARARAQVAEAEALAAEARARAEAAEAEALAAEARVRAIRLRV